MKFCQAGTTHDHLETINGATDEAALTARLETIINGFGIKGFSLIDLDALQGPPEHFRHCSNYDAEWVEHYTRRGYMTEDPLLHRLKLRNKPVFWKDINLGPKDSCQQKIVNEAAEFGYLDGLGVPLHSPRGMKGFACFATDHLDLSPVDFNNLTLIAHGGLGKLEEMRLQREAKYFTGELTAREVEVLKWCAQGKSNWDISVILSLSEKRVEHLVGSAMRKLDTVNRTHAVASAIRLGIIT